MAYEAIGLGEITCPSGELVLLDAGYLGLWSAGRSPMTGAVDLRITGQDARAAARTFDGNPSPYRYDVPAPAAGEFARIFHRHCAERMLSARIIPFEKQVPHRDRTSRAIAARDPGFGIMGVPVVTLGRIPRDRLLTVTAQDRRTLTLTLGQGPAMVRAEHGRVGLDHGHVALADASALASWHHDDPLDGRADVLLHGPAAAGVAGEFAMPPAASGYAWRDLPFDEAATRAVVLQERRGQNGFEVELRPHSHLWQALRGIEQSPHGAATIEVGGATVMIAATAPAEGLIPVELLYDVAGVPVAAELRLR
jgi:hypothetical protein